MDNKSKSEHLKEITQKLEQGIKEIFDSHTFKNYLSTMSKFHNYSYRNSLLIMLQKPEASYVAGFNTWKNTFNRYVKKGEKGIEILAPTPYRVKVEIDKIDPTTQQPIINQKTGEPSKEIVEVTKPAFRPVYVFDVTQTDGEPLPELITELKGNVHQYENFINTLKDISPFPLHFEDIPGDTKGYCDPVNKKIAIKLGMSEIQTLKTTIHEITHADLHVDQSKLSLDDKKDRRTKEVEAESVAFVVCNHYGIDTSNYSFTYIAAWSKNKELDELKNSLDTIQKQAFELIDRIDNRFQELLIPQEKQKETIKNKITKAKENNINLSPKSYKYSIYQLNTEIDASVNNPIFQDYHVVYSGIANETNTIENIYQEFHYNVPEDFRGHLLAIGDIIVLEAPGGITANYISSYGFENHPDFAKEHENRLQSEILDTIKFDNDIDLDRERLGGQISFKDKDKPFSIADKIIKAKNAFKERSEIKKDHKKEIEKGREDI